MSPNPGTFWIPPERSNASCGYWPGITLPLIDQGSSQPVSGSWIKPSSWHEATYVAQDPSPLLETQQPPHQTHGHPCRSVQLCSVSCRSVQLRAALCSFAQCSSVQPHAGPCSFVQLLAGPCSSVQFRAAPCRSVQLCAMPCRSMQLRATMAMGGGGSLRNQGVNEDDVGDLISANTSEVWH